ncbi:MAG: putative twin-arginine translocation pathway signal, partial [Streblomastix strix]
FWIVHYRGHWTLVDAGQGKQGGNLEPTFQTLSIKHEDITTVLLTHMHPDHIAGLIDGDKPVFPKAKVLLSEKERDFWLDPSRPATSLPHKVANAYGANFQTLKYDTEVVPGIFSVELEGHTAGHTAFEVVSGPNHLVLAGDFVTATDVQFAYPEESATLDDNKEKSAVARRRLMDRAAKEKIAVAGTHIIFPGVGYVKPAADDGFAFVSIK